MKQTEAVETMAIAIADSLDGMPTEQRDMVIQGMEMPLTIGAAALVRAGVLEAD